ncbi:hypothetical protein [Adlercreutzia sp. ZJ473]|uniref:hypothetical protein n=1 Tax=Adlercreutzia sp. ZJ473 TaxID=2722822 RepID=UPI001551EE23|nr:hypothetical protein [Adlercreutzia sp. ZJ473]
MAEDKPDGALSPVDIIAQARGSLGSEQPAAGEPAGSSSQAPRTREEHLRRATGSFSAVSADAAGGRPKARAGKAAKTNNPRVLKAEAAKEGAGEGASAPGKGAAAGAVAEANTAGGVGTAGEASAAATAGAADAGAAGSAKPAGADVASDDAKPAGAGAASDDAKPARPSVAQSARVARPAKDDEPAKPKPSSAKPERRRFAPPGGKLVALVACAVVVAVLAGVIGGFSFFRWGYADDAADIQGTWYIEGTDVPITFTEGDIVLNDEVTYRYVLNADEKNIVFTFSYLQGAGHYRFSLDRQQLAIMDGTYSWWDTLVDDLGWTIGALVSAAQGTPASPAGEGDVTLLSRTSASESAAAAEAGPADGAAVSSEGGLAAVAEGASDPSADPASDPAADSAVGADLASDPAADPAAGADPAAAPAAASDSAAAE